MKAVSRPHLFAAAVAGTLTLSSAHAQTIPAIITTPDRIDTSIGPLEFKKR